MKKSIITLLIIFLSLFLLPLFLKDPNLMNIEESLQGFSINHLLGTDQLGRDYLSRCIVGGRNSLLISLAVTLASILIGFLIGALSLASKLVDEILMRLMDALKGIPALLFASLLSVTIGRSPIILALAMSTAFIPQCARLVRSEGKNQIKSLHYLAGLAMGHDERFYRFSITFRHSIPVLVNQIPFIFSSSIILEATLSFIGAGLSEDIPTLGGVIQSSRDLLMTKPHMILCPVIIILFFTLSFSLLGEKLKNKRY